LCFVEVKKKAERDIFTCCASASLARLGREGRGGRKFVTDKNFEGRKRERGGNYSYMFNLKERGGKPFSGVGGRDTKIRLKGRKTACLKLGRQPNPPYFRPQFGGYIPPKEKRKEVIRKGRPQPRSFVTALEKGCCVCQPRREGGGKGRPSVILESKQREKKKKKGKTNARTYPFQLARLWKPAQRGNGGGKGDAFHFSDEKRDEPPRFIQPFQEKKKKGGKLCLTSNGMAPIALISIRPSPTR